ncbi:DUF4124 domain-containing protein [Candidatus Nitrosacidococcus tergens]|uniref:DUF4124 domain-containing protein n=1 Tax=Candidatus Nitrosacidococcus tergens TaxID=553981 RepID=A0A7G1QB26_9GAMM|nr:DUF4124 domain-containing protein [Candidatus Nitrosacidococcus tergens]CAB1277104.1 conserved protein of unknown function [Candidatus Nitrosacidococcus tergens]
MVHLFLYSIFFIPLAIQGKVYEYTDSDGTVEYSDQLRSGGKEVKIIPLRTYTPPVRESSYSEELKDESQSPEERKEITYQIGILAPPDGASIQNDGGQMEIVLQIAPKLEADEQYIFRIIMDNEIVGMGKADNMVRYILTNINRGAHMLQAQLFNPSQKLIAQSQIITVYIHRMSILFHSQGDGVQRAPMVPMAPSMPGPAHP